MTRCHRQILRARTIAVAGGIAFVIACPSLGFAFDARLPPPEYAQSAEASTRSASVPAVRLSDHETGADRVARRLTPRGESPATEATKRSGLPSAGSVLSAMALVMLAIFAAARLWKLHGPKMPTGVPRDAAEVLGRCRIEAKQSLYLVKLGSRILVLGSGNGELTTLSEITDAAEVDLISSQCRSSGSTSSPFSRLFEARQSPQVEPPLAAPREEEDPPAFTARPTFGTAERRLAERFRGHASDKEPGRVA